MDRQNPAAKLMAEHDNLMQRLKDAGVQIRHTRLHGTQMLADPRLGWEPLTRERAESYLRYLEPPSKLDISGARMRG